MLRFLFLSVSFGLVCCQINWVSRGNVPDPSNYFSKVVQQLIYDLEKREWCNLKIQGLSQTLNETLYQWKVAGTATYSNGFVISIQAMDLIDFGQSVFSRTVNGESVPFATIEGKLNMHEVKIGFDVLVMLEDPEPPHAPVQRYTGEFTHPLVQLKLDVTRNLLTKEMTASPSWSSVTTGGTSNRMAYLPANNLTEVLARSYGGGDITDSVSLWCREIIGPMLVDISTNRVDFPEICFNNCPR